MALLSYLWGHFLTNYLVLCYLQLFWCLGILSLSSAQTWILCSQCRRHSKMVQSRMTASHFSCQSQVLGPKMSHASVHFWLKMMGPKMPSFCLILCWNGSQSQEVLSCLHYQFAIKQNRCGDTGSYTWDAAAPPFPPSVHHPPLPHCVHHVGSLQTPSLDWALVEIPLLVSITSNQWSLVINSIPPTLPWRSRDGADNSSWGFQVMIFPPANPHPAAAQGPLGAVISLAYEAYT